MARRPRSAADVAPSDASIVAPVGVTAAVPDIDPPDSSQPPQTVPHRAAAASAKIARGSKMLNAGSATGLIAYFSALDMDPPWKGLFLLSAPWMAIVINTTIAIIGVYASGYTELYARQIVDRPLRKLAEASLQDTQSTADEKADARETIQRIDREEVRILKMISTNLGHIFSSHSD